MDEEIRHICNEAEISLSQKNRQKLEACGICTVGDLLKVRERIENGELDELQDEVREKLLVVADWRIENPDADVLGEGVFNEEVYATYAASRKEKLSKESATATAGEAEAEAEADESIDHVCKSAGILAEHLADLTRLGVRSSDDLSNLRERIRGGELDALPEGVRDKLLVVAEWRARNPAADILTEFDVGVFDSYQLRTNRTDGAIKHVCREVGIPDGSRVKLEDQCGVRTADDLEAVCDRIQNGELDDLREEVREKLLIVAEWKRDNPSKDIMTEFNEDVYDKLYHCQRWAEKYIRVALGQPSCEQNIDYYNDVDEDCLRAAVKKCTSIVMESQYLKEQCGKFDYETFIEKCVRHFHELVGKGDTGVREKLFIIAGNTQAGKSSVKGVIQSLCGLLKIPLIVLTKGVDESISLHTKLVRFADGKLMEKKYVVVASSKNDGLGYRAKDAKVFDALDGNGHGGTLVIADTHAQVVNKACKAIKQYLEAFPGGNFVLIVDEADAMFRTTDGHQKFEQALQQLLNLKPSMTFMISATPVSFMLELVHNMNKSKEDIEFLYLKPQDNYVGIEKIKPLEVDGKPIYLDQNELNNQTNYAAEDVTVGYFNEKTAALVDDCVIPKPNEPNRKGQLLLFGACPRVYADNNIKQQCVNSQKLYRKRGYHLVSIAVSGSGIDVIFPPCETWSKDPSQIAGSKELQRLCESDVDSLSEPIQAGKLTRWHNPLIGSLLEFIDDVCGLEMPVLVFGYTKMCRGISFRSNKRVPTHMVVSLGRGHNCATVVQTLGRATYNGKDVLEENGFDSVTVLMTSADYTLCVKMQNYISHVARRMQEGDTFADAVTGANEAIPDCANFLRHTFRELGRIKGGRMQFEYQVKVEKAASHALSPDEQQTRDKFWTDTDAQTLLRSLARLRKGNPKVCRDDIIDDLDEAANYTMPKKTLNKLLGSFCDTALISKEKRDKEQWYKIPLIERLETYMNPDEGEMPDEEDRHLQVLDVKNESSSVDVGDDSSPRPNMNRVVSNVSELSSVGSKKSPTIIDLSDDCSISSVSMVTSFTEATKTSPLPKAASPEKKGVPLLEAQSEEGKRVAKHFPCGLHFGTVVDYCEEAALWSIYYDDGDEEQLNRDELRKALRLYRRVQSNDHTKPAARRSHSKDKHLQPLARKRKIQSAVKVVSPEKAKAKKRKILPSTGSSEYVLTDIDGISSFEVSEDDVDATGTCIDDPKKKRRIYYARRNETVSDIAKRFNIDANQIIQDNRRRPKYKSLCRRGLLQVNSPIVLPPVKEEDVTVSV